MFSNRKYLRLATSETILRCIQKFAQRPCSSRECSPLKRLLAESAMYNEREVTDPELKFTTLPYTQLPKEHVTVDDKVDPRETSVILFPGQGSQYIGMGKTLLKYPVAKEIYEISSEVLGMDIIKLCTEGPKNELNRHCQLAIMVTSLATVERLREERPSAVETCVSTAGFSLGEITALVFAGALRLEQALKVVQIRATAMEAASQDHSSGMITVFFGPDANLNYAILKAKQHCQANNIEKAHCQIANYLFPSCKVIAGTEMALQYIEKNASEFGIKRTQRVQVSGGFHTEIMQNAMIPVREALKMCDIMMPKVSVISNVDAKPYRNQSHIIRQLPKQITRPVRWEQCLHALFSRSIKNYPHVYTIGPGSSMRTILKQVNAKAWDCSIQIDSN